MTISHVGSAQSDLPPSIADSDAAGSRGRRRAQLIQHDYEECPQAPSLHCKNGSTCRPGVVDLSGHDLPGVTTHEAGYYCQCPKGFTGHECQIEVNECDGAQCYHGSTCKSTGRGYYCDCKELNDGREEDDTKFAGSMCQHESTSLCAVSLVGETAPNHQFCTNHGKCVRLVSGGEPHPGCICKSGWDGDHCEIRGDPFAKAPVLASEGGKSKTDKILISALVIGIVAVVILIAVLLVRAARQNKEETEPIVFQGGETTSNGSEKRKSSVGIGDLEPDGSGTLGDGASENGEEENGEEDNGGDMKTTSNGAFEPESEIV